jgi:ferredoxin
MNQDPKIDFVTVTYKKRSFTIPTTPTLLAHLRAHGVPVNQGCLQGICGTCKVKLLQGEVEYHARPLASVRTNEVLTCICAAKTHLEIEDNIS